MGINDKINFEIIRDEDRQYLSTVVDDLKRRGFSTELCGSALKGDQDYKDIDILVRGSEDSARMLVGDIQSGNYLADSGFEFGTSSLWESVNNFPSVLNCRLAVQTPTVKIDLGLTGMNINLAPSFPLTDFIEGYNGSLFSGIKYE